MSVHLPALTTLVAVLLDVMTLANVAFARAKYKIVARALGGGDVGRGRRPRARLTRKHVATCGTALDATV